MSEQSKQIGFCGYDCGSCAARSGDPEVRQKLVDGWRKYFGHQQYNAENVECCGCRSSGEVADRSCEVRPCAMAKGVDSCVDCDQFPCGNVRKLAGSMDAMVFHCLPATSTLTEEEYDLCLKQFASVPNLIKEMIEKKKLPDWLKAHYG